MINFTATILVAAIGAVIAKKLHFPAPGMIGGILAVMLLNAFTDRGFFPSELSFYVRLLAGIYIGSGIRLQDLKALRHSVWGALVALIGMLTFGMFIGFVLAQTTSLDFATCFLGTAPGGTQEMTLLAMDVGGDPAKVAAMQVMRFTFAVAGLPFIIRYVCKKVGGETIDPRAGKGTKGRKVAKTAENSSPQRFLLILVCAFCAAKLFVWIGVPAATMVGPMLSTCILATLGYTISLPSAFVFVVQTLAGAYVGSGVGLAEMQEMRLILIPAIGMLFMMVATNLFMGMAMVKISKVDIKTAMYACAPGGLSDMIMVSADVGADTAVVTAIHILRLLMVISLYPTVIVVVQNWFV
ncbi:AbrB family transcriptional regulator [Hominifimenecus sp. rT4P-3]|uniref:AbrB family transcriptional regulator n=1 Tax=Hominifimenecus sp. rT4P-3 TaxID=3242979 RepID=UPI003DA4C20E